MTKALTVSGLFFSPRGTIHVPITVRVTADSRGKSMSLAAEDIGMMLKVGLEGLEELVLPAWESDDAG